MKKSLYLGAMMLTACTSPETSISSVQAAETRKVAEAIFAAFNAHDWTKMESYYTDSVQLQDPAYPGGKTGKTGMSEFYRSVPDIHDEVQRIYVDGNIACVEFISTGTMNGQKFTLPICTVLTIENGLVTRDNTYYDAMN
jgi:predicted SnoaL-like aldol condensation-catalyzing enzyme